MTMLNKSEIALIWHDETTHPASQAMATAMQAAGARMGLVKEWQDFCNENYEGSEWVTYFEWLETQLELTLEGFVNISPRDAIDSLRTARIYVDELECACGTASRILTRSPAPQKPVPLKVQVEVQGAFFAQLNVLENDVQLTGWKFVPNERGVGGGPAFFDEVRDASGGEVTASEEYAVETLLELNDTNGPFWTTVQRALADRGAISVQWEE